MAFTLATLHERTRRLQKLELNAPALVRVYALSCWAYALSGLWYIYCMPHMPPPFQQAGFLSGRTFGGLLILQGCFSYMNDAVVTFGRDVPFGRVFWMVIDRLLAWTLMINTVAIAVLWPSAGERSARRLLSCALVASCAIAYPTSKTCEVTGRMRTFLVWHSLWHYVPNALAIAWIGLCVEPADH